MTHANAFEGIEGPTMGSAQGNADLPPRAARDWWRDAVVYQVYPRSFADSNGDGIGDLPGLRAHLDHISSLGVDAIWLSPFYPSPLLDGGYDISDPRGVAPALGTLDDFVAIVEGCHEVGLRVLVDVVPNHFSWDHPWFRAAVSTEPGSPEWARFHVLRGRGEAGTEPPNDWPSAFGGSAWSPVPNWPGWWYLHLYDASQPDLNWENDDVRADFEATLRFWFDLGVDGLRIDVAHTLVKAPGYPDAAGGQPFADQPGVHEIWRVWRRIADSYTPPRTYVGEVWVPTPAAQAAYTRPGELHTTFNFHFLNAWWDATTIREVAAASLVAAAAVGAPATWVLSNHDMWRPVTRYAPVGRDQKHDLAVGRRRAVAMSMMALALPGSAYIYQGEELGLPEVLDLPDEVRQDPTFFRTNGELPGRDGCRVPLPWSAEEPAFGFSTGKPWLPQPADWAELAVTTQESDSNSTLQLFRRALRLRRETAELGDGVLRWFDVGHDDVVAFERPGTDEAPGVVVLLATGTQPRECAVAGTILLQTGGVSFAADGLLRMPPDSACWLSR